MSERRFVLDLFPDIEHDRDPQALLAYAIQSILNNGDTLRWDILDGDGKVVATDVRLGGTPWWEAPIGVRLRCVHCGRGVVDSGDGFHFLHTEGPGENSKYCDPNAPDSTALRSSADVT